MISKLVKYIIVIALIILVAFIFIRQDVTEDTMKATGNAVTEVSKDIYFKLTNITYWKEKFNLEDNNKDNSTR